MATGTLSTYTATAPQCQAPLPLTREVVRLHPELGQAYASLAIICLRLNRFDDARSVLEEAEKKSEAAAEFQKILDHHGIAGNEPIDALAHLGLARAYATQGDSAKAKAAYQDFLTLRKDADSEVPILKQAKAEYAKLQ